MGSVEVRVGHLRESLFECSYFNAAKSGPISRSVAPDAGSNPSFWSYKD